MLDRGEQPPRREVWGLLFIPATFGRVEEVSGDTI